MKTPPGKAPTPTANRYTVYRLTHGIDATRHRAAVEARWAIACAVAALVAACGVVTATRHHLWAWAAVAVLATAANAVAAWRAWRNAAKWRQA